jgi:exonuclease SbcC
VKFETIKLENIRSHVDSELVFSSGFNCLVGGLGQGKSTVLFAIDFVLFGDPLSRSYDYMLREDAQQGSVTAVFVQNGSTYMIHRGLKRQEKGITQDTDQLKLYKDGKLIAGNKNEAVAEEIKELTGFDKTLFRELVWIRQEHLKELIDMTPRERQKKLDQLFGLSDYELAWSNLQGFQRIYETEKGVLERDIDVVRIAKLDEDYTKSVEDYLSVGEKLEKTKTKLVQAEATLKQTTEHLADLEELQKTTETLQRREVQLQTNIANSQRRSRELLDQNITNKRRLEEYENQLEQLQKQKTANIQALEQENVNPESSLRELRNILNEVDNQLRSIGGEMEATRREMTASKTKISSIITENKCPRCLQELTGEYKQSLKDSMEKEQKESQHRGAELQTKYDALKKHYSAVNGAVSALQQVIPRIEDITKQVAEKQEQQTKFSSQIEETKQETAKLLQLVEETRAEITKFDVTELESAREQNKTAFRDHLNAKNEATTLEQRKQELALRVDELKERLDYAQQKVKRKERIGRLVEIIERIRVAYRSIQPKLRGEFVRFLELAVQRMLNALAGDVGPRLTVNIDETYSPYVSSEQGYDREVTNLSGGERTLLAFAYRIGLGQLIMQYRAGHGLYMLLLDEPTESLGREDGSVERLAQAISRLKAIEQIIAVTHNEAFAEKAEHVIRIEKEANASQVYVEK